jgi:hypothetical protein
MVGDIRQAVLATNPRSAKNKKYSYAGAIHWFRERESQGILRIYENSSTWRCRPEIAAFADTIFDPSLGFPATESQNTALSRHDGVYLVRPEDVNRYIEEFNPLCLRDSARSGKAFDLDYVNFGLAKGTQARRVLIVPTQGIEEFIQHGIQLKSIASARFYVAVTRAFQSVAVVLEERGDSTLPFWEPVAN